MKHSNTELYDIAERAGISSEDFDKYFEIASKPPSSSLSDEDADLLFRIGGAIQKQKAKEEYGKKSRRRRLEDHQKVWQIGAAYTAFIAGAFLAVISSERGGGNISWAFSLWAISLPFLCGGLILDGIIRVAQGRLYSKVRGGLMGVGLGLSHLGTAAIVSSFSWIGAMIYFLSPLLVSFLVQETAVLGGGKNFQDL
jgi:hypothetical protein